MKTKSRGRPPVVLISEWHGFSASLHLPISYGNHARAIWIPFTDWRLGCERLGNGDIAAVAVPISPNLILDSTYMHFLKKCRQIAENRPAFRLYLLKYDMGQDELFREAGNNPELAEIIDTFNICDRSGDALFQEIDRSLDRYLTERDDIEDAERYKNLFRTILCPCAIISILLTLVSLLSVFGMLFSHAQIISFQNKPDLANLLGFFGGYLFCQLHLIAIARRRNMFLPPLWGIALIVGVIRIPLVWSWLAAGYLLALSLDHLRRRWLDLLPTVLAPDRFAATKGIGFLSIFAGTIWPKERAVFISYARRTWADPIVRDMRERFQHQKINCFLDIADIELGSSWRFALEDGIRKCTLFLFFDDGETNRSLRYWHHAELVSATERKRRTGFPEIVVMTQQGEGMLPISTFRVRLIKYFHGQIYRVVPISHAHVDEFVQTLALTPVRTFGPAETSSAITELLVGTFYRFLLNAFFAMMYLVGNWMNSFSIVFVPILIFLSSSGRARINFDSSLVFPIAFGLGLGFGLRGIIHFIFEAREKFKKQNLLPGAIRLFLMLSILWILSVRAGVLQLLFTLLAVLLGYVGLDRRIQAVKSSFKLGMRSVVNKV